MYADEDEEAAPPRPPQPPPPAWRPLSRSRHGSLREAAGALSRRLAARFSFTRQATVGEASLAAAAATDAAAAAAAAAEVGEDAEWTTPPLRSIPKAMSSYDGFFRGRLLSTASSHVVTPLVHQKSCESHDSTASAVSNGSSRGSLGGGGGFWGGSSSGKMDMMNFNKKGEDPSDDDRKDEASIKGLWKRAFNTLKIRDKEKTQKKKKGGKDDEDAPAGDAGDVDPVYSLLKRAADKGVQKCTGCTAAGSGGSSPRKSDSQCLLPGVLAGASSAASSSATTCPEVPLCRGADCPCLCHNPLQLLVPSITLNDLKPRAKTRKGKGGRSQSLAQQPQQLATPPTPPASPSGGGGDGGAWGGSDRGSSLRESRRRRQLLPQHEDLRQQPMQEFD